MAFDRDNEEKLPRVFPTIVNKQFLICDSCPNELQLNPKLDFVTNVRQEGWRSRWSGHNEKDGVKLMEEWSGILIICPTCAAGNTNIDWGEKYCHACHKPTKGYFCGDCISPEKIRKHDAALAKDLPSIIPGKPSSWHKEEQ